MSHHDRLTLRQPATIAHLARAIERHVHATADHETPFAALSLQWDPSLRAS
jgi:hypothetical protein